MKMKKLLKNAVVYAVAASMLVATPLTASAGLIDAYSISDGTDQIDDSGDPSHTGTVTSTDTNTSVLGENDAKIIGIALDQYTVDTEVGEHPTLKASVIFDGVITDKDGNDITDDVVKQISNKITWKVTRLDEDGNQTTEPDKSGYVLNEILSITAHADDRSVVELNPRKGTKYGNVFVTASIGGDKEYEEYTYQDGESIKTDKILYKTSEVFEKSAEVSIKEYATSVKFDKAALAKDYPDGYYVKHTLDLGDYLNIESDTANDTITWTIAPSVKASATITADGVVTFKKADSDLKVTAVSEKGEKDEVTLIVTAGTKAEKVIIVEDDPNKPITKRNIDLGGPLPEDEFSVTARMVKKNPIKNEDDENEYEECDTTDVITWSSNKTSIVKVEADGEEATLIPVAVGTATITAKASGGASAKLTVTVKATLVDLEITNTETSLYSGQTLQMTYERDPEQSKDAVKWSIEKVLKEGGNPDKAKDWIANPNATINAKGVLTIKPTVDPSIPVKVVLSSKNKVVVDYDYDDNDKEIPVKDYVTTEWEIDVVQSEITNIDVQDDVTEDIVASVMVNATGKKVVKNNPDATGKSELYVPKGRSFTATVNAGAEGGASSLAWSSDKTKVASVTVGEDGKAVITANSSGTATITVSGVYKNNKEKYAAIKATFKVNVKQPATSLTLNNTLVVKNVNAKKAQTVTFKATQGPKGAKETVTWSATKNGVKYDNITQKGKLTIPKGEDNQVIGDVYTVTVKTATGMSATATVKILEKTSAVEIHETAGGDRFDAGSGTKHKWNNTTTKVGKAGSFKMYPEIKISDGNGGTKFVTPGTENAETITYSVNKKGIVNIASDGTVTGLKAGTVKITVKTPTNKKATLTVVVSNN